LNRPSGSTQTTHLMQDKQKTAPFSDYLDLRYNLQFLWNWPSAGCHQPTEDFSHLPHAPPLISASTYKVKSKLSTTNSNQTLHEKHWFSANSWHSYSCYNCSLYTHPIQITQYCTFLVFHSSCREKWK